MKKFETYFEKVTGVKASDFFKALILYIGLGLIVTLALFGLVLGGLYLADQATKQHYDSAQIKMMNGTVKVVKVKDYFISKNQIKVVDTKNNVYETNSKNIILIDNK